VFETTLGSMMSRVEGARAISLVALDGIAVHTVGDDSIPLETLGAELGAFVKHLRSTRNEMHAGEVEQLSIVTDEYVTFLSAVTSDYYLLMVISRGGNYGRARFELAKAGHELRSELI
jgi:predicted regulator of Ras-like GTPase activity (Roadblock/LC7/MglB family)